MSWFYLKTSHKDTEPNILHWGSNVLFSTVLWKQSRGRWGVYLKSDFISVLPWEQPKTLRKIPLQKQVGHHGSSHPLSFCIVGTSLGVMSFPISHWFQWGAVSLTQGHRKSCCKFGSPRKQFLSVHILLFIGPLDQNQLSTGAVVAFLVSQWVMSSVLLHNTVSHTASFIFACLNPFWSLCFSSDPPDVQFTQWEMSG